ncbi:DUF4339 domain-containing protein, partial [Holdemania filiformis]
METNNRWYVRRKDGKKDGSFSDAELAALISKGIVEPEDEIWTVKMADWMVLKDSIYSFYLPHEETPFILEDTE